MDDGETDEMTTRATGTFEMKTWDEAPYRELEGGAKLTRASVTNAFDGEIAGESTLEYLMAYATADRGSFVGHERVVGRVGDRSGSFVLQQTGTFDDGGVTATWVVVLGSGTGELTGLRGEGGYRWSGEHGERRTPFTLDYDVEEGS